MPKFFFVDGPDLWGDYGDILIAGMTGHLPRVEGKLQLERTAPFIPPISFPSRDVIVTDEMKNSFEAGGWPHDEFRPVHKAHIVNFDWQDWDLKASDPKRFPKGGEPAAYILNLPHSPRHSDGLGNVWELILQEGGNVLSEQRGSCFFYSIDVDSWTGLDIFRPHKRFRPVVTGKGKEWVSAIAGKWATFSEIPPANA